MRNSFRYIQGMVAALTASAAFATGTTTPPNTGSTSTATSGSESSASASVGDVAGGSATASVGDVAGGTGFGGSGFGGSGGSGFGGLGGSGAGGAGGAGGSARATGGNSLSSLANDIDFNSKMQSLAFPAHAMGAVVSTPSGCVGNKLNHTSVLWNGFIKTDAIPMTDAACQMAALAQSLRSACQYQTAAMVEARMMKTLVPAADVDWEFLAKQAQPNLRPMDCALLLRPRLLLDARMPAAVPASAPVETRVFVDNSCTVAGTPFKATARGVVKKPQPKAQNCAPKTEK